MHDRDVPVSAVSSSDATLREDSLYREGLVAGLLGAATIAIWFLLLDTIRGRPFSTPSLLGRAFFQRGTIVGPLESQPISGEMVLVYTWVHGLAFCVIGGVAAWLIALAERRPNAGFGVLLFFVLFGFGFIVVAMLVAEPVLHALTWPAILIGNLLAAGVMGGYFRRRHPTLQIWP
jgi:hypothetical protein